MKEKFDIILIYPKTGLDFGSTVAPPHSLLCVAAPLLKDGYKIKIVDQRVCSNWKEELKEALHDRIVCVGISCMTGSQVYYALEVAKVVRENTNGQVPIVWGGPHPSILPEQTLKNKYVDIVCVGEGDVSFIETVKALQGGKDFAGIKGIAFKKDGKIVLNQPAPLIDIENLLPVPWELLNVEDYIHPDMYLKNSRTLDVGQTSRGCPFSCAFCSSASLRMRKWRAMSVEKSLKVIIDPIKRFRLNGVWIRDDEFYIDRERADKICKEFIKQNLNIYWYTSGTRVDVFNRATDEQAAVLKKSGARVLKFGAESGSDRILKLMNKGITVEQTKKANLKAKKNGIIPVFALMIGFPGETFEEINKTIDLSFQLKKDNPAALFEAMATYTALPGTPMYDLALRNGLKPPETLEGWVDWNFDEYDFNGQKIPWYNYKDRIKIGNISYMSILANAVPNVIDSLHNGFMRWLLKFLYIPIGFYYRFRLKNKLYTFSLDLMFIRYLRRKIFYRGHAILK